MGFGPLKNDMKLFDTLDFSYDHIKLKFEGRHEWKYEELRELFGEPIKTKEGSDYTWFWPIEMYNDEYFEISDSGYTDWGTQPEEIEIWSLHVQDGVHIFDIPMDPWSFIQALKNKDYKEFIIQLFEYDLDQLMDGETYKFY